MRLLLRHYVLLLAILLLSKPLFVAYNAAAAGEDVVFFDLCGILLHGLPLDLAVCGYFSAPVWLAALWGVWAKGSRRAFSYTYYIYIGVEALLFAVALCCNAALYRFWGFPLDATVLAYLDGGVSGVTQSVSGGFVVGVVASILLLAGALWLLLQRAAKQLLAKAPRTGHRAVWAAMWVAAGALLFLSIRGGVGKSTNNVGTAYFSTRPFLNHAALNPVFSFLYTASHTEDFSSAHLYYTPEEQAEQWRALAFSTSSEPLNEELLRVERPDVVVIMMEGMCASFMEVLGGGRAEADTTRHLTPNLNAEAERGVLFTRCYANSFRTDRGTVSLLSGHPAYADASVMKQADLVRRLPGIAATMRRAGYTTELLYGGSLDFTNMRSYFFTTGYERLVGEEHFPLAQRRTHDWGVTDAITLDTLFSHLTAPAATPAAPRFITLLTLASHEPWRVPYHRIKGDERANAMAYLDAELGRLLRRLRQTPEWEHLLLVLTSDHGIPYPQTATYDARTPHIPLLLTGGAVKEPRRIETVCAQSDIAATLLGQLRLAHDDFPYSRDVLSATYTRPLAFHTHPGALYVYSPADTLLLNLDAVSSAPSHPLLPAARAYLQGSYDFLRR